jgi:hypothetical protein
MRFGDGDFALFPVSQSYTLMSPRIGRFERSALGSTMCST